MIHGIITTSLKLVGENIFTLMYTNPDLVHNLHQWIANAYIELITYFAKLCNIKVSSVHIGECSGTMLSEDLFEEFVIPYINLIGDKIGNIRLHSCGNTDHLLYSCRKIDRLKILDVGSNTSIKKIREIFGNTIEINTFPPTDILLKGAKKNMVKQWLYTVLDENNGGDLKIAYHLETDYELENCLFIHDELQKLGLIKPGRLF